MFGYVIPDKPNMLIKDFAFYRAHYCGLCMALGKRFGQTLRFATNYDSTFLSLFLHSLQVNPPEIVNKGCILNEIKKKPVLKTDEILERVADVTVLLAYYKSVDDVSDDGKGVMLKAALGGKRKKLAKKYPEIDGIISGKYGELRKLEREHCENFDRVADCFSGLLRDVILNLTSGNKTAGEFGYYLGRWIYIMDALDDLEKDFKKGNYNPFLTAYADFSSRDDYLKKYVDEFKYILYSTYNQLVAAYDSLELHSGEGALSNIVYYGLPLQMDKILKGDTKCQKTRI